MWLAPYTQNSVRDGGAEHLSLGEAHWLKWPVWDLVDQIESQEHFSHAGMDMRSR